MRDTSALKSCRHKHADHTAHRRCQTLIAFGDDYTGQPYNCGATKVELIDSRILILCQLRAGSSPRRAVGLPTAIIDCKKVH